jgi:hypothetical protein
MPPRLPAAFITALALLCAASVATAQEQTGRAEGSVRDQQGGILVGVTVEARNVTVGSVLNVVTDQDGRFRFVALGPGMYDVTASRDGFRPARFEGVEILLGQVKQLDFMLAVGGVQEKASVSADSPLVDVKRSARAVSLRQDQLTYLPRGLDFTSVVPLLVSTLTTPPVEPPYSAE